MTKPTPDPRRPASDHSGAQVWRLQVRRRLGRDRRRRVASRLRPPALCAGGRPGRYRGTCLGVQLEPDSSLPRRMAARMRVASITAAEARIERVRWAWSPLVPLGEPTILAGTPGIGKTQLALGVLADATRGKLKGDLPGAVDVAYISAEDSIEYTLAPRFIAAGGDPALIHFYQAKQQSSAHGDETDPSLQLPADIPIIDQWITDTSSRILVLDPFVAMLPPALSAHKAGAHATGDSAARRDGAQARPGGPADPSPERERGGRRTQPPIRLDRHRGRRTLSAAVRTQPRRPRQRDGQPAGPRARQSNLGRKARSIAYRIEMRIIEGADGPVKRQSPSSAARRTSRPATYSEAPPAPPKRTHAAKRATSYSPNSQTAHPHRTRRDSAEDAGHNWRTVGEPRPPSESAPSSKDQRGPGD